MRPEAHAGAQAHLAHHYPTLEQQAHAARLGMWLFLATEVLLFGGLFVAYGVYRFLYADTFKAASTLIETKWGAVNTVVLISSSLTVALAHHETEHGNRRKAAKLLAASFLAGAIFLVVKSIEYGHHFHDGHLPGRYYTYAALQAPGDSMFWTLYFLMTGLHGLHVVIGMAVLGWLAWSSQRHRWARGYATPVELGGLYWHLVDLIWIFLFPLFYLI
jgi:cytochrome c oxidase subunit 3